jgi:hypothetical protein
MDGVGPTIAGRRSTPGVGAARDLLRRNEVPHRWVDLDRDFVVELKAPGVYLWRPLLDFDEERATEARNDLLGCLRVPSNLTRHDRDCVRRAKDRL